MVPRPQILGPREKGEDSTKYQQEVIPPPSKWLKRYSSRKALARTILLAVLFYHGKDMYDEKWL
jgi:hypothetical protein